MDNSVSTLILLIKKAISAMGLIYMNNLSVWWFYKLWEKIEIMTFKFQKYYYTRLVLIETKIKGF